MRFSIKNRVESLIKRDRISAAIRKLQQFTKDKSDYRETYNTLSELKSKFTQIEKDFKAKIIDYATYDRERSKIRSGILDINNEIEELKETKDKKFIWTWIWAIITGLLIPVLGFLVPMWLDKAEECPVFEDKDCKLLVFNFSQSGDISPIAPSILEIFQTDEYYIDLISAEMDPVAENATRNTVKRKVEQCDASFGIYGSGERVNGKIYVTVKSYKEDTLLADMVDEVRDTLVSISETDNLVQQQDFRTMLNMMICLECTSCPVEEEELLAMIEEVNPEVRANHFAILAQIQYRRGNLTIAENTLSRMINSLMGGIKIYAYRGKVRDDRKKYEPAFEDYSYYLEEKPDNHNVRLKRFTSVYNLLTSSEWLPRYAGYIDIAAEDLKLLKGNISAREYSLAKSRLDELLKIKDVAVSDPVSPGPGPLPEVKKCDFVFQVKTEEGRYVSDAMVRITGHEDVYSNEQGIVQFIGVPCEEFIDNKFTVTSRGYELYESQVKNGTMNVVLNAIPEPDPMCAFSGKVMDENGNPIFSAYIRVEGFSPRRTNKEGIFKFNEAPCDEVEGRKFTIVANGYETVEDVIRNMEMSFRMVSEVMELCNLSGFIMDESGAPVNKAMVSIYGKPNILTDEEGFFISKNFECESLYGLKYTITASGFDQVSDVISKDHLNVRHILKRRSTEHRIGGTVRSGLSNQGLSNVNITLDGKNLCSTSSNGTFSCTYENITGKEAISIEFKRRGYHNKQLKIDINNAEKLNITLNPSSVSGKVVDLRGNPISKVSLSVVGLRDTYTDRKGDFRLILPQNFSLTEKIRLNKEGYQSATVPISQYKSIRLTPEKRDYLKIIVTKEAYNDQLRKWEYVPAANASILINGQEVGTTDKSGSLRYNMTGRINEMINIDVKGINQVSSPQLPARIRFTHNGQEFNVSHYIIK